MYKKRTAVSGRKYLTQLFFFYTIQRSETMHGIAPYTDDMFLIENTGGAGNEEVW